MYLFFDTETTGLPLNYKAPVTDLDNWPRMVQLAWIYQDADGKTICQADYIIKPEEYTIPYQASRIHGITTEIALQEGIELAKVLQEFSELVDETSFIIAHNISFDEKIVGAEFERKKIPYSLFEKPRLCTMVHATNYCQLPGPYGLKWPKLTELHFKLFGEYFDEAHNARIDIGATAKCFWEMRRIGII